MTNYLIFSLVIIGFPFAIPLCHLILNAGTALASRTSGARARARSPLH